MRLVPIGYQEPEAISPYILPIDKTKNEQSFHLDIIHFHFDSAELTDNSRKILAPIAEQLNDASEFNIEVIGHTDSTGTTQYNQKLSDERAQSVCEELKKLGVSEDRIVTSGRSELEPIEPNETIEGRRKNRRTEFKLTK